MFSLYLENENGNTVDLNDGAAYEVLSVSGLNPPPASIFTAKSPNRKGVKYNGSTLDARNIIISVKVLGDVETNRNALYPWADTEQYVKVRYRNGQKNVFCEGHVQECGVDLFTDNEVVDIAILCENPYWRDWQEISTDISALLKQFVFPFAISEDATYDVADKKLKSPITADTEDIYGDGETAQSVKAGIPFSTIREDNTTTIFNTGAETGVKIIINCLGEVKNLRIYDAVDTSRQFYIKYTFPANWRIEIDTESSPKTVKGYKPGGGDPDNLLRYVVGNPTWFRLKKGYNTFGYSTESGTTSAEISIGFTNKYLGV